MPAARVRALGRSVVELPRARDLRAYASALRAKARPPARRAARPGRRAP
jgi:hypothetical protein